MMRVAFYLEEYLLCEYKLSHLLPSCPVDHNPPTSPSVCTVIEISNADEDPTEPHLELEEEVLRLRTCKTMEHKSEQGDLLASSAVASYSHSQVQHQHQAQGYLPLPLLFVLDALPVVLTKR